MGCGGARPSDPKVSRHSASEAAISMRAILGGSELGMELFHSPQALFEDEHPHCLT